MAIRKYDMFLSGSRESIDITIHVYYTTEGALSTHPIQFEQCSNILEAESFIDTLKYSDIEVHIISTEKLEFNPLNKKEIE